MAEKQRRLAKEREQNVMEVEISKKAETDYTAKLNNILATSGPPVDFRRKKVDWYNWKWPSTLACAVLITLAMELLFSDIVQWCARAEVQYRRMIAGNHA